MMVCGVAAVLLLLLCCWTHLSPTLAVASLSCFASCMQGAMFLSGTLAPAKTTKFTTSPNL
jgi:hypothetical protein